MAQFRLNGKITSADTCNLVVNIPYVYGYYEENNINIPVKEDGSFEIDLPIASEKFVTLNYNRIEYTLYLKPHNTLTVEIDNKNVQMIVLSGSMAAENKLFTSCDIYEYPWFLKTHLTNDSTKKLRESSVTAINEKFVQPWLAYHQQKEIVITKSSLSNITKQLFIEELRANALCRATEFVRNFMSNKQLTEFYKLLYETVSPKPTNHNPGPMYYTFVRYHIGFLESNAMAKMKDEKIKPSEPLPHYGVSLDSGNAIVKAKGKGYLNWLAVKNTNINFVAEAYLAQEIFTQTNNKDLSTSNALLHELKSTYPNSGYYERLNGRVKELKELLAKNIKNHKIQIADNYQNILSIYPVVHSLKGKVIYLDVWGTWCGPCRVELKHVPNLKERFKNKDVAFVYLDMDDDDKDISWKEFIKVNEMEGVHLRKTGDEMENFWKELLKDAGDKSIYYPQYFIFDKEGTLVIPKARRPSEGEALYKQIESILNK